MRSREAACMLVGVAGEPVRVSEVFEAERSWLFGLAYRLTCIGWALQAVRVELLECGRPGCGRAPLCSLPSIAAGSCERAGGSRGA